MLVLIICERFHKLLGWSRTGVPVTTELEAAGHRLINLNPHRNRGGETDETRY